MKIEERFLVPFPRERVWAFFHETNAVVGCLPGAELIGEGPDGRLAGRFSAKLGPIAAAFTGDAAIDFDEAAHQGQISGAGGDRKSGSRAKGTVSFALSEENGATRVDLVVDYALAGTLAQFNRGGIVDDLAERLTAQFADNLKAALAAATPVPAPAPLDAGALFTRVIWNRIRWWLKRLFGRG